MRVSIPLLTLVPGGVGGSETLVRGLLTGLAEGRGRDDGNTYAVCASAAAAPSLERFQQGPVRVMQVHGFGYGSGAAARLAGIARARYAGGRLAREITGSADGFDVVHYALTVSVPPLAGARVVTVYDLQHELMPELFSSAERLYRRIFYAGAIAKADVVMTISEFSRQTILERHGVDPERVVVSRQGIDRKLFSAAGDERDADVVASIGAPECYVIYPANLWPHKNHERLLEALARCEERELSLVLTGARYGRWPRLLEYAEKLGVEGRLKHLGYVDRDALPCLYRRAVGTVFPSLFEGLGIPPLEALSCGCPVAAAHVAALPEALGEHAVWFDPRKVGEIAAALDALARGDAAPHPPDDFWEEITWDRNADVHRAAYDLAASLAGESERIHFAHRE